MPKGKGKGKSGSRGGRIEGIGITSDEDSVNDNGSVISLTSDSKSVLDDEGGDEIDEQSQEEVFEEKLRDAIDGLSQKSAQGRTQCLEGISKALIKRFIPDFVVDRRLTLSDSVERCLRRGRGAEQAAAAQLAILLSVQLGCTNDAEQLCRELMAPLSFVARDTSVPPSARAKCCWAMAVMTYLSNCELSTLLELMRTLETIFSGSYAKGDGTMPTPSPDTASLHTAALSAWSLLLTLLSPGDVFMFVSDEDCKYLPDMDKLIQLLDSSHLDLRMAAGEVLALIFELGRTHDDDFCDNLTDDLVERLKSLATDSHKYRAKKDRKTQRSSFRDILQYVEDGIPPEVQVKFATEVLVLDTWCRKKLYDAFCQVLGSGMNCHLGENDMLRDMFGLGDKPSPLNHSERKMSKYRRNLANSAATKARTISRNRNRDKRSTVVLC